MGQDTLNRVTLEFRGTVGGYAGGLTQKESPDRKILSPLMAIRSDMRARVVLPVILANLLK